MVHKLFAVWHGIHPVGCLTTQSYRSLPWNSGKGTLQLCKISAWLQYFCGKIFCFVIKFGQSSSTVHQSSSLQPCVHTVLIFASGVGVEKHDKCQLSHQFQVRQLFKVFSTDCGFITQHFIHFIYQPKGNSRSVIVVGHSLSEHTRFVTVISGFFGDFWFSNFRLSVAYNMI